MNEASELPDDLSGTVGVTAGASAPDELVEAVVARLAPRTGVEEVLVTDEDEYFPPPRAARPVRGLAAAVAVGLGAPAPLEGLPRSETGGDLGPVVGDRQISAADVLARLAG